MSERIRSNSAGSRTVRVPQVLSLQELFARDRRFLKHRDEAEKFLHEPKRGGAAEVTAGAASGPTSTPRRSPSPQDGPQRNQRRDAQSPSKQHFQTLVKKTYFGYESQYPVHEDLARRQVALRPPKFFEQELAPKYTNYRGHSKCKWCSTPIPSKDLLVHQEQCTLRVMRCAFQDTETGEKCDVTCRGQELLQEHVNRCGMRTKLCPNPGCGAYVSAQSTSLHLQHCTFEPLSCGTCAEVIRRCDEGRHRETCRLAMVPCPLLCGELLRREDVPSHVQNTAHMHRSISCNPLVDGGDSNKVMLSILLQKVLDLTSEHRARSYSAAAASNEQLAAAGRSGATSRTATPPAQVLEPPPAPWEHPVGPVVEASSVGRPSPSAGVGDIELPQSLTSTSQRSGSNPPPRMSFRQRNDYFFTEARSLTESMAASDRATAEDLSDVVDDIERNYDRLKRFYDNLTRDGDAMLAGSIALDEKGMTTDHVGDALQRVRLAWRDIDRSLYETKCKLYEAVWMK